MNEQAYFIAGVLAATMVRLLLDLGFRGCVQKLRAKLHAIGRRHGRAVRTKLLAKVETAYGTDPANPTRQSVSVFPSSEPAVATDRKAARAGWFPMPGGTRLEYGASGFYIELQPQERFNPYQLYTPEGHNIAGGPFLDQVQLVAERMAADRRAFELDTPRKGGAA